MSTFEVSESFHCDHDCTPDGCLGHVMTVSHNNTSDTFHAQVDGETVFNGDETTTSTLVSLINRAGPRTS